MLTQALKPASIQTKKPFSVHVHLEEAFHQRGYIVIKNFFNYEEVTNLLEMIQTSPQKAEDDVLSKGSMTFHSNIFARNKKLRNFIAQQSIVDILHKLTQSDLWVRWDQAVAKGPGADTFPWHQDNAYNGLWDGHYQFWIALTKMTPENGGLRLQPGSHKKRLPHKRVENAMVYDGRVENWVSIEAEPGDVVIFSSFLLHSTTPNITQNTRWAYVIEYMSLKDHDPSLEPPYFVVSRNGKSAPEYVAAHQGSQSFRNHFKYSMINFLNQARQSARKMKRLLIK